MVAEHEQREHGGARLAHDAAAQQAEQRDEDRPDAEGEEGRERGPVDVRRLGRGEDEAGHRRASSLGSSAVRSVPCLVTIVLTARLRALEPEGRVERERDDHGHERDEHGGVLEGQFTRGDVRSHPVVHRADEGAQHVDRGQHDAGEGHHRDRRLGLEGAEQDQELAGEVGRAGHGQRGQRDDQEDGCEHGRAERDPAHVAQVLRAAGAQREQPDDEEQRRGHERVVDALQQRALHSGALQREDPERDEPELGHRRVPDHEPGLRRRERHRRAVEDRGQRDQQQQGLVVLGGVREQRQRDLDEPVGGDLREHAGERGQRRQRHRAVGVGQPAVDGEGGHLDEERRGEAEEDPVLRPVGQRVAGQVAEGEGHRAVARGREDAGGDRRREHEQRADERVDHELGRRTHAVGAAELPGQEVERDQHQVEEGHEEQEVLRAEGAEDGRLAEREVEEEELRPRLARAALDEQGGEHARPGRSPW